MDIKALQAAFLKYFDTQSQRAFFAPGRVNLIGEHIDYNGGTSYLAQFQMGLMV